MSLVAVVTGSNKGIGLAIVRGLLKQFKGTVYLTSRDSAKGDEAVKLLKAEGLHPKYLKLDVTNTESILNMKDYLIKNYGGVDIFVHNAGIMYRPSDNIPQDEVAENTINTNYVASLNISNTILPILNPNGRLVLLSSMLSMSAYRNCSDQIKDFFKSPSLTEEALTKKMFEYVDAVRSDEIKALGFSNEAYGISKLGVNALTRILGNKARELKTQNILVNCCCPGWVKTDLGGHRAHLTPDQGARVPLMLALIPEGDTEPNGKFVRDFKVVEWC